jgi:hypothetical protein
MATVSKPHTFTVRDLQYSAEQIRTLGIGENFDVLSPEDGYRKDNRLWFGTCTQCGERVTSSFVDDVVWKHKAILPSKFGGETSKSIDYCPENPLG